MRISFLLLLAPAALAAQSQADATLCDRFDSPRYPEARASVVQLAKAGGARGAFFQGCALLAQDRGREAAGYFEQVVKADERNPIAHFYLGRAYGMQAQQANVFSKASLAKKTKHEFDRAAELDPEYLDARQGLMEYYSQAPGIMGGSKEKARGEVEEIRKRAPYRGALLAANLASRDKDYATMAREYEQLTKQFPDSVMPWASLAAVQLTEKRYDDAFATVERMQKAMPSSMMAVYMYGRAAAESGQQLERGEQSLKKYLGYAPKPGETPLANAHWRLGTIYERRGQKDAARAEYQTAVSLDPKLKAARDALAKLK